MATPKKTTKFNLYFQNVSGIKRVPSRAYFRHWVDTVLKHEKKVSDVNIRIVNTPESASLNKQFRRKSGATNVLSFPFEPPLGIDLPLLGDIVICAPVIIKEAAEQKKIVRAHWAHMVIHGTLHLLGYDHMNEADAIVMEKIEIKLLKKLGYPNPYQSN